MDNASKKKLKALLNIVIEEAEKNEEFANKLSAILNSDDSNAANSVASGKRPGNRRDKAVLDPIRLVEEGEENLREKLNELTEKQLKDIIADYGMDPSKLAMKWKDKERIIGHIIDTATRRATKGDAFRTAGGES